MLNENQKINIADSKVKNLARAPVAGAQQKTSAVSKPSQRKVSETFVSSETSAAQSEIQIKDRFVKNINNKYDHPFRAAAMGQFFDKQKNAQGAFAIERVQGTLVEDPEVIKVEVDNLSVKKNKPDLPDFVMSDPVFERYKKDFESGKMKIFPAVNGRDYEFTLGSANGGSLRGVFKRP